MWFTRKRNKHGLTQAKQKELNRVSDEFFAALAKLPSDWRDVAEGKAKLPSTPEEFRAKCG